MFESKPTFEALHQHYEIRESRYKEKIDSLQQLVKEKDCQINELQNQIQALHSNVKRLNEQVDRLLTYGNTITEPPKGHKHKFLFFGKKS